MSTIGRKNYDRLYSFKFEIVMQQLHPLFFKTSHLCITLFFLNEILVNFYDGTIVMQFDQNEPLVEQYLNLCDEYAVIIFWLVFRL